MIAYQIAVIAYSFIKINKYKNRSQIGNTIHIVYTICIPIRYTSSMKTSKRHAAFKPYGWALDTRNWFGDINNSKIPSKLFYVNHWEICKYGPKPAQPSYVPFHPAGIGIKKMCCFRESTAKRRHIYTIHTAPTFTYVHTHICVCMCVW